MISRRITLVRAKVCIDNAWFILHNWLAFDRYTVRWWALIRSTLELACSEETHPLSTWNHSNYIFSGTATQAKHFTLHIVMWVLYCVTYVLVQQTDLKKVPRSTLTKRKSLNIHASLRFEILLYKTQLANSQMSVEDRLHHSLDTVLLCINFNFFYSVN